MGIADHSCAPAPSRAILPEEAVGAGALDSPLSQGLRIILHFENNAKLQYPISPHGNNLYRRIVAVNALLIFSLK